MKAPVKYKLNNWAVVRYDKIALIGEVEGHPDRKDGTTVVTSTCIGKFNGRIITSNGSHIELGEPKADYAKMFPDAKERLFAAAPIVIGELH
jgi:hypothetical protein